MKKLKLNQIREYDKTNKFNKKSKLSLYAEYNFSKYLDKYDYIGLQKFINKNKKATRRLFLNYCKREGLKNPKYEFVDDSLENIKNNLNYYSDRFKCSYRLAYIIYGVNKLIS